MIFYRHYDETDLRMSLDMSYDTFFKICPKNFIDETGYIIRAVAGQRSSPCALPLNLSKSMTHDRDLKVAQVCRKSIKFQTNIYKHAKYQLDPSTCSRDIDF